MQALRESSRDVVDVAPDATVAEAAHQMHRAGVGCLLVTEDRRPVGILTDRDLCLRAVAPRVEHQGTRLVREVMSSPAECLPHTATIEEAGRRMHALGVRRMPLVDDDGLVVGLLALEDVLALLTGALHDLAVEGLERRRRAWRDARVERAREDLEHLYGQLIEGARQAKWTTQEAFFDELDALKARAKQLFGG